MCLNIWVVFLATHVRSVFFKNLCTWYTSDEFIAGLLSCCQIVDVLLFVAKKEGLILPPELAGRIALHSNRNLRRSILCLEACKAQQ